MTDRVAGEQLASPAGPASLGLRASADVGVTGADALQQLRDIEEIRVLKHRYMRCIDLKLWDDVGDALAPHATFGTGTSAFGKPVEISGGAEIVAFLRARLGPAVLTEHTVSQPEIVVDGDEATGVWAHRERMLATAHRMVISGTGFCEERYERGADRRWRITQICYVRNYEVIMSLDDVPSFRLTAALDGAAQAVAGPATVGHPTVGTANGHPATGRSAAGAADTPR